ncbi:ClpXP protease specificity-enhancing factor, partial [Avibacterium endocarditidis]
SGALIALYARESGDGIMFEPEEFEDDLAIQQDEIKDEQPLSFVEAVDKPETKQP